MLRLLRSISVCAGLALAIASGISAQAPEAPAVDPAIALQKELEALPAVLVRLEAKVFDLAGEASAPAEGARPLLEATVVTLERSGRLSDGRMGVHRRWLWRHEDRSGRPAEEALQGRAVFGAWAQGETPAVRWSSGSIGMAAALTAEQRRILAIGLPQHLDVPAKNEAASAEFKALLCVLFDLEADIEDVSWTPEEPLTVHESRGTLALKTVQTDRGWQREEGKLTLVRDATTRHWKEIRWQGHSTQPGAGGSMRLAVEIALRADRDAAAIEKALGEVPTPRPFVFGISSGRGKPRFEFAADRLWRRERDPQTGFAFVHEGPRGDSPFTAWVSHFGDADAERGKSMIEAAQKEFEGVEPKPAQGPMGEGVLFARDEAGQRITLQILIGKVGVTTIRSKGPAMATEDDRPTILRMGLRPSTRP